MEIVADVNEMAVQCLDLHGFGDSVIVEESQIRLLRCKIERVHIMAMVVQSRTCLGSPCLPCSQVKEAIAALKYEMRNDICCDPSQTSPLSPRCATDKRRGSNALGP